MPFPWKKVKNTKISQLVTDHLDSQRRLGGPPLVVETGFPTSLVDLFVKNRQRLKKPSKMRKKDTNSLILKSPSPVASPSLSPEVPSSWSSSSSPLPSTLLSNMVEVTDGEVVKEVKEEDENFKGVLLAVLRMFFVVVLALGTKKFAVGLTMSAFFLFFVEYVGIYSYRLLIPCSEAKKRLRLMIGRVFKFVRVREEKVEGENGMSLEQEGQQESNKSCCSDIRDQRLINPIYEIEITPPKRFLIPFLEDIQCQIEEEANEFGSDGKSKFHGSGSEVVVVLEKEEYKCEVMEFKKGKSRRAKIKTKMKHLFRRKSRSSQKEERDLEGEISSSGVKNVMLCEEQESGHENGRELKSVSDLSSTSIGSDEGEEALNVICNSGVLEEEEDVDGVVITEEERIEKKGNSGYLLLCLIVLIGLFGGRISALMFILSWCFMKKSGGKLRRCLSWPVIRFFYPNS